MGIVDRIILAMAEAPDADTREAIAKAGIKELTAAGDLVGIVIVIQHASESPQEYMHV